MIVFCRFDLEKKNKAIKDVSLIIANIQEKRVFENEEYEVYTLFMLHKGKYECITDVLDFEVE